ncbi:RAB-3 GTPase-activating protein catalytic subunit, putative, partial [Ixodes scapularis]
RFIASVEAIIHEWKLTSVKPVEPLKEGELSTGCWETSAEDIKFASFSFKITRHYLAGSTKCGDDGESLEDEPAPFVLEDMMNLGNDFPPRAHYLVRWYGLRDFLVISPSSDEEAISNEDKTRLLVSSVCVALTNSKCPLPVFVQLHHPQERLCYGVCLGSGLTTYFDMVHLSHVPQACSNLSGLLSLFKSKLSYSSQLNLPPIQLTIRFTYLINDWSFYIWPHPPPDVKDGFFDMENLKLGKLPFGALEDPIGEMQLSVTWPSIPEDIIVDNDVYSDLCPANAPKWSVRMRWNENPHCLMEEYLGNFAVVCNMRESLDDVLKNMVLEDDLPAKTEILDALDRLAQPNPLSFRLPQMPQCLSNIYKKTRKFKWLESYVVCCPTFFLFFMWVHATHPCPSPAQAGLEQGCVVIWSYREEYESFHSLKTTHTNSLLWRLALAAVHVYHTCGGIEALAQLWVKVVAEIRYYWENNLTLP